MIYSDYATFTCPACNQNIVVSSIKGQEFHNRIETPTEFICPKCKANIIFSTRTKILFRIGVLSSFLASPLVYWLFSSYELGMILMVGGLVVLSIGLLSQKLKVVETKK